MKQTFSTKILTIGFGCIVAIQGWQFMPYNMQIYITDAIVNNPASFWLYTIGIMAIGIAVGSEDRTD